MKKFNNKLIITIHFDTQLHKSKSKVMFGYAKFERKKTP